MKNGEVVNAVDGADASMLFARGLVESALAEGRYKAQCFDAHGNLKWEDTFDNVVTTAGKNFILDTVLGGSGYTAAWYMGLISNVSYGAGPVAGDTMASHSGWTEAGATNTPSYSQATRPAPAFSAAAAGVKATSAAVTFSINGGTSVIVKGAFLTTVSTKDGTTGTLLSAGLFSGGDKTVSSGDTLTVTYQLSV